MFKSATSKMSEPGQHCMLHSQLRGRSQKTKSSPKVTVSPAMWSVSPTNSYKPWRRLWFHQEMVA